MIEIVETNAYPLSLWREALEVAEVAGFCPIDTREWNAGELGALGAWMCDELYGAPVKPDENREGKGEIVTEQIIDGALAVLDQEEREELTPADLRKVIESYRGESFTDFEELAREYAETDYIGPDDENPALTDWEGFDKPEDFEKWYIDHATCEGEVCGEVREGGTLIWFDKFKW